MPRPNPAIDKYLHSQASIEVVMIIKSIYELFCKGGLVRSQRQFSTEVCGRGPSYYSSSVARGRDASIGVLLRIERMVSGKLADVEALTRGEISRRIGL